MKNDYKDVKVWNAQGTEHGVATGSVHHCSMEGCGGLRVSVRWPDGKITFPCSRGLLPKENEGSDLRIG